METYSCTTCEGPPARITDDARCGVSHDQEGDERFVCPDCSAALRVSGEELACPDCHKTWPVLDGVPHFVQEFPYWGEIPLEKMRDVNRRAESGSWREALLDFPDTAVQRASQMILNVDRANWHWFLNLPPESRVLDVGAGMGTNSHALGMHYREVVATEPVLERVQFMRQRFAQEKLSNVKVVRTSLWALPFPNESFDLIVLNGVLEWVAEGSTEDPGRIQDRALRKLFGLLKPGGYLYLGIENRLGYGYFIGYRDPHCGLPFVTILPRRLAHWYARRKGHAGGYRNYLYSSRGYRKLLHSAGFAGIECYLALPSYNHPRFLVPLEGNVFSYYSRNFDSVHGSRLRGMAHAILMKLRILQHLEYSFAILARK